MNDNNKLNVSSPERRETFSLIGKGFLAAILLVIPGIGRSIKSSRKKINVRLHRDAVSRKAGGRSK